MTASMWVHDLAWYSLQIALLVSAGALLVLLFRLRAPAAILAYWQILLVACILLPFCQPWKESVTATFEPATQVIDSAALNGAASGEAQSTPQSLSWPIPVTLLLLIGAGIAVRCAWLAAGFCTLHRFRRESFLLSAADKIRAVTVRERTFQSRDAGSACLRARPGISSVLPLLESAQQRLGIRARFYTSDKTAMPITFGLLRPVVLLPQDVLEMEPHAQEAIIYHELLHVRRRDWIYSLLEEFIRTILWFHPAIWWLIGRIHLAREQVVDQSVIQLTQSREQYVEALLAFVRAKTLPKLTPATLFFRKSLLKKRVAGIFKETTMSKRRLISCLVISFCALLLAARAAVWMFPLEARGDKLQSEPVQVLKGGENLLHRARVEYPHRAIEKRVEGDVALEVSVDEQGLVSDARVLSGPEELRRAALQSVLQWHYAPPAPARTQVLIHFQLPAEGTFHDRPVPPSGWEEGKTYSFGQHTYSFRQNTGLIELQPAERQIKEIQEGLADPKTSLEQKAELKRQLEELNARIERTHERIHEEKKTGLTPAQHLEREIKEIQEAFQSPNTTAEDKAKLKRRLEERYSMMEKIRAEQQPINGKLTAIRTERVSDTARDLVLARLGIQLGDVINEETAQRIKETVSGLDEHFRVVFHRDSEGGITLVIVGPERAF